MKYNEDLRKIWLLLIKATESNNLKFIEKNFISNTFSADNRLLDTACELGYFDIVKFYVNHGVDFTEGNYNTERIAKSYKKLEIAEWLEDQKYIHISLGDKYPYYDKSDKEKLIDAIRINPSIFEKLSDNSKNLIKDIKEFKPLFKPEEYGLFENMNQEELNKQLLKAAKEGDFNKIKSLISQGADIEAKNTYNCTALICASNNGHLEVVKYLIQQGANINAKDIYNQTALIFASKNGHLDIIKYLIQQGADIEAKNNANNNALRYASIISYLEVVKYLKNDAWIESTLGLDYDYTKNKKQQIIDAVKKNPSIIDKLDKEELKNIPEIQHLLKSEEYGLFERKIKNYKQFLNVKN